MNKTKNMRIAMLCSNHPPLDNRVFYKETLSLHHHFKNDMEVFFIYGYRSNDKRFIPDSKWADKIHFVPVKKISRGLKSRYNLLKNLYKTALKTKANVYHCHEIDTMYLCYKLKKRLGDEVKVIYDMHEYDPYHNAYLLSPKFLRWLVPYIFSKWQGKILKTFDEVITVSDFLKQYLQSLGINNVLIIPNVPLLDITKRVNILPASQRKPYIIYEGGISIDRGLMEMLDVMRLFRDNGYRRVKLLLIGKFGSNKDKEFYNNFVKKHNLKDSIIEKGWTKPDEVYKLLSEGMVGLLILHLSQNYLYASPNKLFDYMVSGLPVIVNEELKSSVDIVKEIDCGDVVNISNPDKIFQTIKKYIENPYLSFEKGKNGKEAILSKYNFERHAKGLYDLYEKLLFKKT